MPRSIVTTASKPYIGPHVCLKYVPNRNNTLQNSIEAITWLNFLLGFKFIKMLKGFIMYKNNWYRCATKNPKGGKDYRDFIMLSPLTSSRGIDALSLSYLTVAHQPPRLIRQSTLWLRCIWHYNLCLSSVNIFLAVKGLNGSQHRQG